MKKLTLVLTLIIFSMTAYCEGIGDMFDFGKEKAEGFVETVVPGQKCPITNDTPLSKIDRSIYEFGVVLNAFVKFL